MLDLVELSGRLEIVAGGDLAIRNKPSKEGDVRSLHNKWLEKFKASIISKYFSLRHDVVERTFVYLDLKTGEETTYHAANAMPQSFWSKARALDPDIYKRQLEVLKTGGVTALNETSMLELEGCTFFEHLKNKPSQMELFLGLTRIVAGLSMSKLDIRDRIHTPPRTKRRIYRLEKARMRTEELLNTKEFTDAFFKRNGVTYAQALEDSKTC